MIEKITNQNQIARHKLAEKINELIYAINEFEKDREEIKAWIVIVSDLRSRVPVVENRVSILEEHAHPTAETPDYDDTDDIAEVKNENLYTKSIRMDKEFAEEEMERLQKELIRTRKTLDYAKWWLNEIVESHRYTPISTAEMALKEITALEQKDTK